MKNLDVRTFTFQLRYFSLPPLAKNLQKQKKAVSNLLSNLFVVFTVSIETETPCGQFVSPYNSHNVP